MGTMRLLRSAAKEFIRALASYMTQTHIPDLNSGLRAMKRDLIMQFLPILPPPTRGSAPLRWLFEQWLQCAVDTHPVLQAYRALHISPHSRYYNYLSLVVRTIMYFNPLRIFLPITLGLLAVGIVKMIYDIFTYHFHFAPSTVMLMLTVVQLGGLGLLADLIVRKTRL